MIDRQIPEWLAPYKNEWLSAGVLADRIAIVDGSFSSWFASVKHRCRSVTTTIGARGRNGNATYYLVKNVWQMALAHQIVLVSLQSVRQGIQKNAIEKLHHERLLASNELQNVNDRVKDKKLLLKELTATIQELEKKQKQLTSKQKENVDSKVSLKTAGQMGRIEKINHLVNYREHYGFDLINALLMAEPPAPTSGVYFLILRDVVVYVGRSKNVLKRMSGHAEKQFDRVLMIRADDNRCGQIEEALIKYFDPVLNINMRPTMRPFELQLALVQ